MSYKHILCSSKTTTSLFDRVDNTEGKGENAGYQHFLLFPQCFPKPSFKLFVSGLCGKELTLYHTMNPFDVVEEKGFIKHSGKTQKC